MTRNLYLFSVALLALPGCMLDRSALGCPVGTMYEPGGALCVPFVGDADQLDGGLPVDGDVLADSGVDAWIIDGDAGPLPDAWIDPDGGIDAGSDAGTDGGRDAGPLPDAGMRRCEDTTSGICIRFTNLAASPPVTDWMTNFIWTRPGGSILVIDWAAGSCIGGIRTLDAMTTECEIEIPDPGEPVIGGVLIYAYPSYASGPACTSGGCPNFHTGYRMWKNGTEFPTDPTMGRVSQESRPTPAGSIVVLRITPP